MTKPKKIQPRTESQKKYLTYIGENELVFGVGPAGTGKTYLAAAHAISGLVREEYDRVIMCRPAIEAGERLGFLPGDLKEKVNPYLRPLYDAMHDIVSAEYVEREMENGKIEIVPLAFMRGRTFSNACVILDEAQNVTKVQMKMFLTRAGEKSRMIVTGDPTQIDLADPNDSGLLHAVSLLERIEGVATVRFDESDVVRSRLVKEIVRAYEKVVDTKSGF